MKARFWAQSSRGNWAKLTLEDGQVINSYHRSPTEEGYNACHIEWSREGEWIYREITDDGRDCDGRFVRAYTDRVHISKLNEIEVCECVSLCSDTIKPAGFYRPDWQECSSYQRDYTAEVMGY